MVNLAVFFLSFGSTLLVLALRLVPLRFTVLGKKEKLWGGLLIAAFGFLVMIVQGVLGLFSLLKSQEVSVLANTLIPIITTGLVLVLQEGVEKRRVLKVIGLGILVPLILGVACIVGYSFLRN